MQNKEAYLLWQLEIRRFPGYPDYIKFTKILNSSDKKERYFNMKLHSARAVIEKACDILKVRWRILSGVENFFLGADFLGAQF